MADILQTTFSNGMLNHSNLPCNDPMHSCRGVYRHQTHIMSDFNSLSLRSGCDFKMQFWILFYWLVSSALMIMLSDECHGTSLMISSTLVQVMAWCCQAPSHYLSQCWHRSISPYEVTRLQGVKELKSCNLVCRMHKIFSHFIWNCMSTVLCQMLHIPTVGMGPEVIGSIFSVQCEVQRAECSHNISTCCQRQLDLTLWHWKM